MGIDPAALAGGRHTAEVRAVQQQYRQLPATAPVRLAKPTSNLFRFGRPEHGAGLDVSGFTGVLDVDTGSGRAQVGGMATYETVVDTLLRHGRMPWVVPQLKTITLGGAVAGLGIESTSFRNGLPHESVREMEILSGDGSVVVATEDNEHAELFRGFPNSYGTLGYTLRLEIETEPVRPFVRLRHVRFSSAEECAAAIAEISARGEFEGATADFLDGTVFGPDELYLTVGTMVDEAPTTSDYVGRRIYYRSIQELEVDHLRIRDYLWRWDTDWFWCSRALGVQHPMVRPLWPRRYRRSDVYRRVVAWDRRFGLTDRLASWRGQPRQEPVVQDVEVPVDRVAEFLDFFHREIGISPVWLCPVRLRDPAGWPLYPMDPETLYVNVGFWSSAPLRAGQEFGHYNRLIEQRVSELDGHKSLYSTSYYDEDEFWRLYNKPVQDALKQRYDPDRRLPGLYEKCVQQG
ncbi:FAD-binding protein [Allosaccharopolyspora coralli]|uniref:Delta(24)-sterol reductase n=1 Tax=Allosaccharopolyspora coralli TaxID=2665642 RepID=A0A5Q3QDN9_9PSEU|nr:FAD-binding oxidoreductase [Allosaccharopolyspora coralli]QGK69615.1 FAD-binding protein [Allosaccharopolyspora coralli]